MARPQAMQRAGPLESIIKRDRLVIAASLLIIAGLAWAYTVNLARSMEDGGSMAMSMGMANTMAWTAADFWAQFAMWSVMMFAMMIPSAAPMIMVFATVNRRRRENSDPYVPTFVFLLGYLILWAAFSAAAAAAQWGLHQAALLSSMMGSSTSAILGARFYWPRHIPVDATEVHLPQELSLATGIPDERLAGRLRRGLGDGHQARDFLRCLLLGVDGAVVRHRDHEPAVGRRHRRFHSAGEGGAQGAVCRVGLRVGACRTCWLDLRRRIELTLNRAYVDTIQAA